ncbi:hypothetical protein CASFOL_030381 [Castilleja foliolosa]|uniref:Uncharacterized protein n=1 Tax=Castilleja foliolosa TaxID=1961234 RepID=A0ABD3C8G4_9LAMI
MEVWRWSLEEFVLGGFCKRRSASSDAVEDCERRIYASRDHSESSGVLD